MQSDFKTAAIKAVTNLYGPEFASALWFTKDQQTVTTLKVASMLGKKPSWVAEALINELEKNGTPAVLNGWCGYVTAALANNTTIETPHFPM